MFVRASGMVFDTYLGKPTTSTYSRSSRNLDDRNGARQLPGDGHHATDHELIQRDGIGTARKACVAQIGDRLKPAK